MSAFVLVALVALQAVLPFAHRLAAHGASDRGAVAACSACGVDHGHATDPGSAPRPAPSDHGDDCPICIALTMPFVQSPPVEPAIGEAPCALVAVVEASTPHVAEHRSAQPRGPPASA